MPRATRRWFGLGLIALVVANVALRVDSVRGATRTWIGVNADWVDGGSTALWSPADEPDSDDAAVFNTSNTVKLGSNNIINGLSLSGGIDLLTNNFDLSVDGLVQLTGVGTNLFVGGAASQLTADNVTVDSQSILELTGGVVLLDEEVGSGVMTIKPGGSLYGNGTITLSDSPAAATTLLDNNGTLIVLSRTTLVTDPPPVGKLTINGGNSMVRFDLDGSGETGIVSVNRNQTLDINVGLADASSGKINLFQNAKLDIAGDWTMESGTILADNGAQTGTPSIPAGASMIAGGKMTQTGGTITVVDTDGALQFDAAYQMDGGTLTNNGLIVINSTATQNAGIINFVGGTTSAVKLSGHDATFNAAVNVTGAVQFDARVAIGGTVTINTAGQALRLNGGDNVTAPNTIAGGTINGPGTLAANADRGLRGYGTINANIDFDDTALLAAKGGTLTINGSILDVDVIGTADDAAVLNIVNAWNSNVTNGVRLGGGELKGGTIIIGNTQGVFGHGLVSARVINNQRIEASGGTLVVETAANDNDWDGTANNGTLAANAGTLELRDTSPFGFTGSVVGTNGGRVFTKGFALDFNAGSTIDLSGSKFESTNATSIGGAVVAGAGADSTIEAPELTLAAASTTTLNGNLRLASSNATIAAGATFSGNGAVVVADGSHLVLSSTVNINALVKVDGTIQLTSDDTIGQVDVKNYEQSTTGQLFVETTGATSSDYDRLIVNGTAKLDGYLNVDVDGAFVPALGNTFDILSASGGVTGKFNQVDISGFPAGLTVKVNYLPLTVQLQVVTAPFYSADFDHDGDVDLTDFAVWKAAFGINSLGDADGDHDTDSADYTLWQDQRVLGPIGPDAGAGGVQGAGNVPEPATLGIMLVGLAAICGWRAADGRA